MPEIDTHEHHVGLAAEAKQIKQKLLRAGIRRKIGGFIRFIVTAIVIFIITFVGLNWGAYTKRVNFWLKNQQISELSSSITTVAETPVTLQTIVKPKELVAPKTQRLIANKIKNTSTGKTLPDLSFAVTPPDNYLFIPRLNIKAPIKETKGLSYGNDWKYIEAQIQKTLQDGLVRLPGTAKPGKQGNAFITGHSSYYPWDSGRYKDIFALLPKIRLNDDIFVFQDQQKYLYRVSNIREVLPTQTEVLAPTDDYRLTLMTCTPVGTALKRLIVTALLVNPNTKNQKVAFTD